MDKIKLIKSLEEAISKYQKAREDYLKKVADFYKFKKENE